MAERHGPTDGGRFKRAKPSGNHKSKKKYKAEGPIEDRPSHKTNGKVLNRINGETLCTPEMIQRLVDLIRVGNYRQDAAAVCGINSKTFYEWLLKGGRGEEPYAQLSQAVEKAAAEAIAHKVGTISKASAQHWQAAAWWLERTNPKNWGRKDALELSGNEDKPLKVMTIKFGDKDNEEIEF